jgi:hypothetical protein
LCPTEAPGSSGVASSSKRRVLTLTSMGTSPRLGSSTVCSQLRLLRSSKGKSSPAHLHPAQLLQAFSNFHRRRATSRRSRLHRVCQRRPRKVLQWLPSVPRMLSLTHLFNPKHGRWTCLEAAGLDLRDRGWKTAYAGPNQKSMSMKSI